jgi:hypothetical protein
MQALLVNFFAVGGASVADTAPNNAFKKPGFYTDNFHILPEVDISIYRDDNIYASGGTAESDLVSVISPSISVASLWRGRSLKLDAGADVGRYHDNTSEDYEDYWVSGEGDTDLSDTRSLYASAGYSKNHESRDSKETSNQQLEELTSYDAGSLQVGVTQQFAKTSTKFGMTYDFFDYDNVGSELYNDDRDRSIYGAGLRLAHPASDRLQIYTQAIVNQRNYKERQDQFGYRKDSLGYNAVLGLTREVASGGELDFYLGHLYQEYDDSRFDQVSKLNYGADLRWYPSKRMQVRAKLDQSLNETTEVGASGYLYRLFDFQIDQKLSTDLLGYLGFSHGIAEFQEVGREDVTRTLSIGLKYYASPWVMFTGSYSYVDNDSNDLNQVNAASESYDYERNLFFLTLRARLAP